MFQIAFLGGVKDWLGTNLRFMAVNGFSHVVAGMFFALVLYPFLNEEYKKRSNYFLFVFFPALLGSVFPDILFIISTFIRSGGLEGWDYLLRHEGDIHSAFHQDIALALVVPTTVFLILVMVYGINGVRGVWGKLRAKFGKNGVEGAGKIKLDKLPRKWLLVCSVIAFVCAVLHILMDVVGF